MVREELKLSTIETEDDVRTMIEDQLDRNGPFTHNLIGMILRRAADKIGRGFANDMIDEYSLEELYGIPHEKG